MKHLLLVLTIGFIAMGCRNFEKGESINSDFTGTWQLNAYYDGMRGSWQPISNGTKYVYTFKKDSTFTSDAYMCGYGTYEIKGDSLKLHFECPDYRNLYNPTDTTKTLVEKMKFEGRNLVLSPTYLFCDEGCSYRFIKISNQ